MTPANGEVATATVFDDQTQVYQWNRLGKVCPTCDQPILWTHDGYLWKGACGGTCDWSHISMAPRVYPDR